VVYSYTGVSAVLILGWFSALVLFRSREPRAVGTGVEEFRRVARACTALFGTVAIVSFLLKLEVARGYLAVALPLGLLSLLLTRWLWRRWLEKQRAQGSHISTVVVVGSHNAAAAMAQEFERVRAGYRVAGVCVPGWGTGRGESVKIEGRAVPVLGDETAVIDALRVTAADVVAVSNTESLGTNGMRALAWQLEAVDADLVVAPGVVDVAGPRLQIHPVAGLPLLHVDRPQYRGAVRVGKLALDVVGAGVGLLLLWPLFIAVALLIKLDSPGPVFYRAERIGLNGEPFKMLKFRSMTVGAEHRLTLVGRNEGAGPLFKMRDDPRVTRVGRWLRRLSVDELPQLINVLQGQMSIVGPRPPLRSEVATYSGEVSRRLLVRPGITGLWQVSGRSDLSWEESVRLDLYYVENWSIMQDLIIVWRTLGAVLRAKGAY
jgi:exopolysaccharide biosynthesis polyprenyl glycosylphosphotransferase